MRALRQPDHLLYDPLAEAPTWLRLLAVLSRYFRLRFQGQPVEAERIAIAGLLQRAGVPVDADSLGEQLDEIMDQRQQQAETLLGA